MPSKFDNSETRASYMAGIQNRKDLDAHENVFVFGTNLASLEVMQMLSMIISPSGLADHGQQMYHFINGSMDKERDSFCCQECYFQSITGTGDFAGIEVFGRHEVAERVRGESRKSN